jgi:GWxTD domain-containing protein
MRTAIGLALALALPAGLAAQTAEEAGNRLTAGDTAGAIAVYDAMLQRKFNDAETHYRVAVLHLTRLDSPAGSVSDHREAEEHLRFALRFARRNPTYQGAIVEVLRMKDWTALAKRARERVPRFGSSANAADEAYQRARGLWTTASAFGVEYVHREWGKLTTFPRGHADAGLAEFLAWQELQSLVADRLIPRLHPGAAERLSAAEAALRDALNIEPLHLEAAGLLLVVLGASDRWEDGAGVTGRLVQLAPDSARAWALHGLALARTHRWRDAGGAFDSALGRMTESQRAPFRDLRRIMSRTEQARYERLSRVERRQYDSLYWQGAEPLALSESNEAQTEFYARVVYAQCAWGFRRRGVEGLETAMGLLFVRYGPPDLAPRGAWIYLKPELAFPVGPWAGLGRGREAIDDWEPFRVARFNHPVRLDNVPLVRTLDTILVQTARFRGVGDSVALLVVGAIPLRRMADSVAVRDLPLQSGAVVTDAAGREVRRDRVAEAVTGVEARELQYRSWRLTVVPGTYTLRVEAHLPTLDRGARGLEGLAVAPLGGPGLALSDLLVAQRVAPRESSATRWSEYFIEPNAGRFEPGEPVGLLWEMYNLAADSAGTTHYEVGLWITVEALDRTEARILGSRALAAIVGGVGDALGLTAVYDDRVSLGYQQQQPAAPGGARAEHLMVELRDAPKGRYLIEIIVRDLVTGQEATTSRTITIGAEPVRRGGF